MGMELEWVVLCFQDCSRYTVYACAHKLHNLTDIILETDKVTEIKQGDTLLWCTHQPLNLKTDIRVQQCALLKTMQCSIVRDAKLGGDPLTFILPVYVVSRIQKGDLHLQ